VAIGLDDRQTGNGDRLASTRISTVLELEESPSTRPPFPVARGVFRQNVVHPQNEWLSAKLNSDSSDNILAMIVSLQHLLGWIVSSFCSREDLVLENLALRRQLLAFAYATTSHSIDCPAQAVLACVENVLVWVEEASRLGYSPNRCELASSRVSFVLGMDLKIPTSRRAEACQQRGSRPNLSDGWRESDLGSAAHSRRTAQAGFRSLGKECLAMDAASPKRSRSRQALADVPQKPSRGHCGDGLLHRPNAHVWCSVLLFHHRPRPA